MPFFIRPLLSATQIARARLFRERIDMPPLNAYLAFDGTCKEAMKFYERVLGGKLEALITYGDTPGNDQPVPAEHKDRIMHAYLVHKDFVLMAGDAPPGVPFS